MLSLLESGELDTRFIVTDYQRLSNALTLYKQFHEKKGGIIKVFLRP